MSCSQANALQQSCLNKYLIFISSHKGSALLRWNKLYQNCVAYISRRCASANRWRYRNPNPDCDVNRGQIRFDYNVRIQYNRHRCAINALSSADLPNRGILVHRMRACVSVSWMAENNNDYIHRIKRAQSASVCSPVAPPPWVFGGEWFSDTHSGVRSESCWKSSTVHWARPENFKRADSSTRPAVSILNFLKSQYVSEHLHFSDNNVCWNNNLAAFSFA